jgi:hypothetical protein
LTAFAVTNGTQLSLWDCLVDLPGQQWSLHGAIQGLAGKCLDVTKGSPGILPVSEQLVQLWTCTGSENQKWTYVP